MRFNPKDIGKQPRPSNKQLEKEGWGKYDERGKDMTHPQYGKKAPWVSERWLKNPVKPNGGPAEIGRKEYDRLRYLANREEILERSKKYQKENPEVTQRANKKYYEKKVRIKNEFSKKCNKRDR